MKKILTIGALILMGITISFAQNFATDFTATDCNGVDHNLFSELDDGKVIIIAWVMPCFTCIEDPVAAHAEYMEYTVSHPGQVLYYLVDDFANTSCSSLNGWASNYGFTNVTTFSDAAVNMSDYGDYGMPKIVVLGGPDHKVYYNENSSHHGIGNAIDQALADMNTVGIDDVQSEIQLTSFPNPAREILNFSYKLNQTSKVSIEVINMLGTTVKSIGAETQSGTGVIQSQTDISTFDNGFYFLKITTNHGIAINKFCVSH